MTELPSYRFRTSEIVKRQYSTQSSTKNKTNLYKSKDFEHHCKELKEQFLKQGYNSELLDKHIKTAEELDKNELIKGNKKDTPIITCIPLAITYNQLKPILHQ